MLGLVVLVHIVLFNKNFMLVSKKKERKRKKNYLGARDTSRAPERLSFGDVALIAGISRPKRRYELSFGPFFGLWGCGFDALHVRRAGVSGGGVGCGGDRWLARRGREVLVVIVEVVEVSCKRLSVENIRK